MTDRATLEALLARVLEGNGPDRELDAEITCAVNGVTMHEDSNPADGHFAFWYGKPWESVCSNCSNWPPYTTSLDAALTLVPEGWHSLIGARPDWPWVQMWEFPPPCRKVPTTNAPTIQRALIAACLKARMEAQGE